MERHISPPTPIRALRFMQPSRTIRRNNNGMCMQHGAHGTSSDDDHAHAAL